MTDRNDIENFFILDCSMCKYDNKCSSVDADASNIRLGFDDCGRYQSNKSGKPLISVVMSTPEGNYVSRESHCPRRRFIKIDVNNEEHVIFCSNIFDILIQSAKDHLHSYRKIKDQLCNHETEDVKPNFRYIDIDEETRS